VLFQTFLSDEEDHGHGDEKYWVCPTFYTSSSSAISSSAM
jgi:hypothetical protein